ncbi:MAG TPA: LamG domain-containing protein, partial [Armatimonadota bacterium]|nr:LamG domain-containing protein [Armatimonadota bacterium]
MRNATLLKKYSFRSGLSKQRDVCVAQDCPLWSWLPQRPHAIGLLMLLVSLPAMSHGAETSLVGYWPFDATEGLAVIDASGNGRHGEILNNSLGATRVTGRSSGAIEFDGGDQDARGGAGCVAIPGLDAIDWSEGLTVEVWVRFTDLQRPSTYEIVSNTQDDRGKGFRLMLSWASLLLRSGEGGAGETWGAGSDPTGTSIRTDEWYHLAGTYDGSVFRVYVDGALVGESAEGLDLTQGQSK